MVISARATKMVLGKTIKDFSYNFWIYHQSPNHDPCVGQLMETVMNRSPVIASTLPSTSGTYGRRGKSFQTVSGWMAVGPLLHTFPSDQTVDVSSGFIDKATPRWSGCG